jgi:hypothetical protein
VLSECGLITRNTEVSFSLSQSLDASYFFPSIKIDILYKHLPILQQPTTTPQFSPSPLVQIEILPFFLCFSLLKSNSKLN